MFYRGEERLSAPPLLLPFRVHATSPPRLDSCSLDGTDHLLPWLLHGHQTAEATKVLGPQCRQCLPVPELPRRPPRFNPDGGVLDREGISNRIDSEVAASQCASRCLLRPTAGPCDRPATGTRHSPLPSAEINLPDKIIWFGDRAPTAEDLRPCLQVRKAVVLRALKWLRLYNKLYRHITINQTLLDSWAESFIPHDLEESMIHSESDHEDHEGYTADLEPGNHENHFQEALDGQVTGPISTGCVYSDVESARQHPTLQLVSTILNLEKDRFERDHPAGGNAAPHYVEDVPVIRYISTGRSVLMNDWQDPEFFTGSFPTLFPLGSGGYLPEPQERPVPVSLQAWAKWALTHHSRRYVSYL